jgi:ceramide glucosyltransferase
MHLLGILIAIVAAIGTLSSSVFLGLAIVGARRFHAIARGQKSFESALSDGQLPFVSILKPLHGMEPQLEENIESFFAQDYPDYEIVFAADSDDDPALLLARKVAARHPGREVIFLANGEPPWPNPPAYSYFRMAEKARGDILVTSDSDVIVGLDYLRQVVPPLLHRSTGMLTCVYRGLSTGGFWSLMNAIGMSVEMTAGVVIANWMEGMKFGLGPTIVVRRDALDAIGGFRAVGEYFSNDFVIGNFIAAKKFEVVLSRHIISHVVPPMSFSRMWQHQLRWAAGTRRSRPLGHLGTGLVFAVPYGILALIAGLMLGHPWLGAAVLAWSVINRIIESLVIGWGVVRDPVCLRLPWLYAVRDALGFAVWAASYIKRRISWRNGRFELADDGKVRMRDREGKIVNIEELKN